jgi:hypothetical protein
MCVQLDELRSGAALLTCGLTALMRQMRRVERV